MSNFVFKSVDGTEHSLDMEKIWKLEDRKAEVAYVTKFKAQELMRSMEEGFSLCALKHATVSKELARTENAAKLRRAIVLLDVVPEYEQKKGKTSADQREAIVTRDEEYQRIMENHDQLSALNRLLRDKMDAFRMSFSAVKKVYDSLIGDGTNI